MTGLTTAANPTSDATGPAADWALYQVRRLRHEQFGEAGCDKSQDTSARKMTARVCNPFMGNLVLRFATPTH
jgi:hypothetical protein